ncbi:MAG: hypothetical protein QM811_07075 [Pirellulales bacterium]
MVKLADPRYILNKFGGSVNKGYNVRGYVSLRAPDATDFIVKEDCYRDSLNDSGELWTWQAMFDDLWGRLPSGLAGVMPTLPRTIDGYPEGFLFTGESLWRVINGLLDLCNMAVAWNPFQATFSVVDLTVAQDGLADLLKNSSGSLFNAAPFWGVPSYYPSSVVTHFPEGTTQYGSLNDTVLTTEGNYLFHAELTESVVVDKSGVVSETILDLYDERQARTDDVTFPLDDLATEAIARKTGWQERQQISESFARMEIQGVARIPTGSQVKAVYWRNFGSGTVTEIARFPGFGSSGMVYDPYQVMRTGDIECRKWLDVARKSKPIYPQVIQWIKLYDGIPDANGFYAAHIQRGDNNNTDHDIDWSDGEPCFVRFTDDGRWNDFKKVRRKADLVLSGRLNGSIESTAGVRPLVMCDEYVDYVVGKLTGAISFSTNNTVNVWYGETGAEAIVTGLTVPAIPWQDWDTDCMFPASTAAKVQCKYYGSQWYLLPLIPDYRQYTGFDGDEQQFLSHTTEGCLAWVTPNQCVPET